MATEGVAEEAATPGPGDPEPTEIDPPAEAETRLAPAHRVLEREPLTPTRKFVYFLIALSPFIAFVLLLPRGGEETPAVSQSSTPPVSSRAVRLAFPFESPTPQADLPSPESVAMDAPPTFQCSDGIDNDRDGRRDFPADSGCSSRSDNVESSSRRAPAPPPPPPPPPPPAPAPAPSPAAPPAPSPPDNDVDPPPMPPSGPACEPGDPGFPTCAGFDNDDNDGSPALEIPEPDPEEPDE